MCDEMSGFKSEIKWKTIHEHSMRYTLTHAYTHTVTSIQYANDFKLRLNLKTTTTKKSTENTNVTKKSEWKSDKLNALINIEWKKAVKMFYFHYFVFVFTSKNMYEAAIQRKKETELRKKIASPKWNQQTRANKKKQNINN